MWQEILKWTLIGWVVFMTAGTILLGMLGELGD